MKHLFAQTSLENAVRELERARDQITEYIADNGEDHRLRYHALAHMTKAIEETEKAAELIKDYAEEEVELAAKELGVEV